MRTLPGAFAAGLLMSVAFSLGVFSWFATAIRGYTGAPWPLAVLVVISLVPFLQPQFVVFAIVRHLVRARGAPFWRATLTGACAYVGSEWAAPKLFADTLGHGFQASPLMRQAADLAGAQGLTFLIVIANECVLAIALALRADRPRAEKLRRTAGPAATVAVMVAALLAYGTVRLRQVDANQRDAPTISAGLVQSDISQYGQLKDRLGTFEAVRLILDAHFALSRAALARQRLDVLVWPETVYPTTFGAPKSADGADFDREIATFADTAQVPLVFGAYDADGGDEYNAAMFLEPRAEGRISLQAYRKSSLFPLTERVPALLENEAVRRWLPWLGTWKPGSGPRSISIRLSDGRDLHVAPLICYDAVDPRIAVDAVRRGAEVIVTLSNDSWFASGQGPHLHLVVSAFRSIETRRPQIRATNTGISAIISASGELLQSAGVHERASLVARIAPERRMRTLMLAWGDWFGPTALWFGSALLAWAFVRRAKQSE